MGVGVGVGVGVWGCGGVGVWVCGCVGVCVCVDLLKRSKTCTVFGSRGAQHITGTVSNEATSDMGYWI